MSRGKAKFLSEAVCLLARASPDLALPGSEECQWKLLNHRALPICTHCTLVSSPWRAAHCPHLTVSWLLSLPLVPHGHQLNPTFSTCSQVTALPSVPSLVHAKSLQLCPTLCNPTDWSLPGSSVHGILQARTLEWVAVPSSRGSFQPRAWTRASYVSCIGRRVLYHACHLGSPAGCLVLFYLFLLCVSFL